MFWQQQQQQQQRNEQAWVGVAKVQQVKLNLWLRNFSIGMRRHQQMWRNCWCASKSKTKLVTLVWGTKRCQHQLPPTSHGCGVCCCRNSCDMNLAACVMLLLQGTTVAARSSTNC
jgi:hypothetical protein